MDEHETLVEYSEMTSFNFNSEEFQEIKRDYIECRNILSKLMGFVSYILSGRNAANNY